MIVDVFLNLIRDVLYGDDVTMPGWMGVGTGTTAVSASDTTLATEITPYGSYRSEIGTKNSIQPKKIVYQLSLLPSQANGNALTEVGLFCAQIDGNMANRIVHTAINKTSSFELIYQITIETSDV